MESDSGNRQQLQQMGGHHFTEPEHLPCPRCDSTNTKFCYYNNYNLSQPRHFCKSCRRYWTQGGTLRNIPVGGGTRKTAKRSRTSSTHDPILATPLSAPSTAVKTEMPEVNLNEAVSVSGGFSSLLNQHGGVGGSGFLALGGFGLGLGSGFDEVGFNVGRVWSVPDVGEGGGAVAAPGFNTWQMGSVEGVFPDGGDCFGWPDLAISTPGNCLK